MSKHFQCEYCQSTWEVADNEPKGKPMIVNISTCTPCKLNSMERLQSEIESKSRPKYSDINQTAENLIAYIQWERAIRINNEIIKPTRKFGLQTLIDTYSKIGTEKELTQVFKEKMASEEFEI